jgi:hypothetical protein
LIKIVLSLPLTRWIIPNKRRMTVLSPTMPSNCKSDTNNPLSASNRAPLLNGDGCNLRAEYQQYQQAHQAVRASLGLLILLVRANVT